MVVGHGEVRKLDDTMGGVLGIFLLDISASGYEHIPTNINVVNKAAARLMPMSSSGTTLFSLAEVPECVKNRIASEGGPSNQSRDPGR